MVSLNPFMSGEDGGALASGLYVCALAHIPHNCREHFVLDPYYYGNDSYFKASGMSISRSRCFYSFFPVGITSKHETFLEHFTGVTVKVHHYVAYNRYCSQELTTPNYIP